MTGGVLSPRTSACAQSTLRALCAPWHLRVEHSVEYSERIRVMPGYHLATVLAILTSLVGLSASTSFAAAPSATASCTTTVPKTPLTRQRAGVASTVVPGKPGVLLGCRYALQPTPGSTDESVLVSADLLSPFRYTPTLNAARPAKDAQSCPESSALIALVFRYPDRSRVLVTVQPDGCRLATNGARTVVAPRSLIAQLNADLGAG